MLPVSIHPGGIDTNMSRHLGPDFVLYIKSDEVIVRILKSLERGAATTLIVTVGKEWGNKRGKYLDDCGEARRGKDDNSTFGVGYIGHSFDQKNEGRLCKDSLKNVRISTDD